MSDGSIVMIAFIVVFVLVCLVTGSYPESSGGDD